MLGDIAPAVGAEILRAVIQNARSQLDHRIFLVQIDAQIRIALVILEQDVVLRHVALDERAFEHQRLKFRSGNNDVEMVDLGDHAPCLWRMGRGILKILADTVFELLGLADVDDRAGLVLHDIDARLQRETQRLVLEFFKCHNF